MISFYQKINDNNYKLIIFNSGSGLQHHEEDKENKLFNITRSVEADKKTTIEIISFILLLNKIKIFERKTKRKYAEDYYYSFINEYFTNENEINDDNFLNEIKFQNEQLSGSCTFFGFYYNFFYINTKYNVNVEDFKTKLKDYSEDILITQFEDFKNYKKELNEYSNENEKFYYYTELEKCIIDLIKRSSNKSNNQLHKQKMLSKIEYNYNNYIKSLKDNKFKLDTGEGILISEYLYIKNINIESIEKVLFSLQENNNMLKSDYLFNILILRYSLDQDDTFFKIKNLESVNQYLADLFDDFLQNTFPSNIFILKLIIIRIIDVNYQFNKYENKYLINQNEVFENISDIHIYNSTYLYRIKPLNEKNFNLYKRYYKLINLKMLEKYGDEIKVNEFESNLIQELSEEYKIDLKDILALFNLVTNQKVPKYKDIIKFDEIRIEGLTILFKTTKEIYHIDEIVKEEFTIDNLDQKSYIDPNKIINFLNNQEIDNINNYYNDFLLKSEYNFYSSYYDSDIHLLNDEYNINRIDLFNVKNDNKYLYNANISDFFL